jgi:hypothetical protein
LQRVSDALAGLAALARQSISWNKKPLAAKAMTGKRATQIYHFEYCCCPHDCYHDFSICIVVSWAHVYLLFIRAHAKIS